MITYVVASADAGLLDLWRCAIGENISIVEVRRFEALPNCIAGLQARLALLDLRLARTNTVRSLAELRKARADTSVIAFVPEDCDPDQELSLLRAGVRGICRLEVSAETVQKSIQAVLSGELWTRRTLVPKLVDSFITDEAEETTSGTGRFSVLTPREIEIVHLVGQGSSNKRIARHLAITERTVKGHLTAIFRKTGIDDRVKLALLIARRH